MGDSHRYLLVTLEAGGNVPAVLGVGRRLVQAGHRVDVLTEPCLREVVVGMGAEFLPFGEYFVRTGRKVDLIEDGLESNPLKATLRAFDRVVFGPAGIVADQVAARLGERRYDAVGVDVMMPGGLIAAEAVGIPSAILHHMPEYLPGPGRPAPGFNPRSDWIGRVRDGLFAWGFGRLFGRYLGGFNEVRVRHGLRPLDDLVQQLHTADRRLILTSAEFDFPLDPAPANVRYVGPVLDDPDWTGAGWRNPWPDDDGRPLIVVGLSSTFQNQADAIRRVIAALGMLDVRGLVTLGPAMERETFDAPPNVRLVASASHSAVFPHAAAVVTHAGHGTVMRALAAGLPVVCMPMGRDQDDNAVRVSWRGAGLKLKPTASRDTIAAAVRRVITEPDFRRRAVELGARIRQDAEEGRVVREMEAIVSARPGVAVG